VFGKRKQKNARLETVVMVTIPHDMWGNPRVKDIEKAISDHMAKGYRLDKQYAEINPKRTMLTFILEPTAPAEEAKGQRKR
jgi:hypothetical protein